MTAGPTGGVVLVGPRGAGKSTLAPALATELGWSTADTDDLIALQTGRPVAEFLLEAGEAEFRKVEEGVVLAALASNERRVLALGGGAVLAAKTRARLARPGHFVVFLAAPIEVLVERANIGPARPPLTDLPAAEEVAWLLERRRPHYLAVADLEVDTFCSNVTACVRSIMANMGHSGG